MAESLLGKRLKELRKANDYSQADVASMLGISRQTYSHYETGRRKPSTDMLYKLAGYYKISIDDLMHLTIDIDRNIFYDAPKPTQSSEDLASFLDFFNDEKNRKKFQYNTNLEKELLYYFQLITDEDKREIIEFTKIKAHKAHL